jgi:tetratricopeptide (TPR) repeat protein
MSKNRHTTEKDHPIATILKLGLYVIAFIPLIIFSEFLSPFHFGKVIVFRSIIEVMVVFYVLLLLSPQRKRYLPTKSRIFWAFAIFTVAFGITSFAGIDTYQSFWGTLERMGGWFTFLHYFAFFTILVAMFKDRKDWIRLIQLTLFVGVLSALYGFLQKTGFEWVIGAGGRSKIFGTIGNPALFAGYMIINAFLALTMFFSKDAKPTHKNYYFSVFLMTSLAIFLTGVRGSVLGWVVGLAVFGFLLGSRKWRKLTVIFLIFVAISASMLYSLRNTDFVKSNQYLDRYADISPTTYTIKTRTWAWGAGIDGWNDSVKTILVGYGPENFNYPFSFHFNPNFYRGPGSETLFDRAHNMFIEVFVTMGILGFLAYIYLFAAIFRTLKKLDPEDRRYSIGLIALIIAYMIHNSFIFDTSANFIAFFTVAGFIHFLGLKTKEENSYELVKGHGTLAGFLGIILLLAVSILIFKVNVKPVRANYATTRAIIAAWSNEHTLAIEKYKEALSYEDVPIKYEIRHRFAKYIIDRSNSKNALQNQEIVDTLNFAIEEIEKNVEERPDDYLPLLYLARLHIMLGKDNPESPHNDEAVEVTLKALEISPTFVRSYFEVAQAYLNKKDFATAQKYFAEALELNPETKVAAWYLGMAYIDSGEVLKGLQIIEESGFDYGSSEVMLLRMVSALLETGNFWKVTELYEKLVMIQPNNPQYYASLAVSYAKIGKIPDAVAAAQRAAQLDPSFAPEAQAFINSITGVAQ